MHHPFRIALAALAVAASTFAAAQPGDRAAQEATFRSLKWLAPGAVGQVDGKAEFKVTEGYTFLGTADTDKFLQLNGNIPPGNSYTVATTKGNWFGILHFEAEGYVKDDEKIDADQLLAALKEQNAAANEVRRKQGYPSLVLEGWQFAPRYDTENKRLEWGTRLRGEDQQLTVNVSTKILGRSGYTSAILVTAPQTAEQDLVDFKSALKNFQYVPGEKYSEWKPGDKVAAYGLGALVLGGAAAVATSKGGLKAIGLAIAAAAAAVWAGVKRFVLRKPS